MDHSFSFRARTWLTSVINQRMHLIRNNKCPHPASAVDELRMITENVRNNLSLLSGDIPVARFILRNRANIQRIIVKNNNYHGKRESELRQFIDQATAILQPTHNLTPYPPNSLTV